MLRKYCGTASGAKCIKPIWPAAKHPFGESFRLMHAEEALDKSALQSNRNRKPCIDFFKNVTRRLEFRS